MTNTNTITLKEAIGATLKNERTYQNRTLRDISASAFVSLGYISELERGVKEVSSGVLEHICSALYMSVTDFMTDVVTYMRKYEDKQLELKGLENELCNL